MRKLVLFDIDGTILHAAGAGRHAVLGALAELVGDGHPWQQVRFDGKTDPQIVRELLVVSGEAPAADDPRIAALCESYVALLEAELARADRVTTVLPGIVPLLDALEARDDVVLGLLTGNVARGAALKLRSGGLDPARFRVGAYGSDSAHRHELPPIAARRAAPLMGREPAGAEVVIIGDTPADITCGRGIGARAIAVATGSYAPPDLAAHAPWALFRDLADTARVLDAIFAD